MKTGKIKLRTIRAFPITRSRSASNGMRYLIFILAALVIAGGAHAQLEFLGVAQDAEIGDVLNGIFRFALGLVGLAALIMLVVGGVMYMTAGDSQNLHKTATETIWNAIYGLILALLSYLILFTINPDLTERLKTPSIDIKKADLSIKNVQAGGDVPPPGGSVQPGAAQPKPDGTCNQYHFPIGGQCFGYVTEKTPQGKCSPPELYVQYDKCHLRCSVTGNKQPCSN